jgi:hypothetical protein
MVCGAHDDRDLDIEKGWQTSWAHGDSESEQKGFAFSQGVARDRQNKTCDRCYPSSQVSEAIRYLETGRARGKVVITVEHSD